MFIFFSILLCRVSMFVWNESKRGNPNRCTNLERLATKMYTYCIFLWLSRKRHMFYFIQTLTIPRSTANQPLHEQYRRALSHTDREDPFVDMFTYTQHSTLSPPPPLILSIYWPFLIERIQSLFKSFPRAIHTPFSINLSKNSNRMCCSFLSAVNVALFNCDMCIVQCVSILYHWLSSQSSSQLVFFFFLKNGPVWREGRLLSNFSRFFAIGMERITECE